MSNSTSVRRKSQSNDAAKPHVSFPNKNQTSTQQTILAATGIEKSYYKKQLQIPVLRGVDLEVREAELLSIVGHSGSGKSRLLHLLGTFDQSI